MENIVIGFIIGGFGGFLVGISIGNKSWNLFVACCGIVLIVLGSVWRFL